MEPPALKRTYQRRYLGDSFDPGESDALARCFRELKERPIDDLAALEAWCLDWSELVAAFGEGRAQRYIDHTVDTRNQSSDARYRAWIEDVEPVFLDGSFALEQRLTKHSFCGQLPREFGMFLRRVRNDVDLYRAENVPLLIEERKLKAEYNKIAGSILVVFDGVEYTAPQMGCFLESPDRAVRERAYRGLSDQRLEVRERIESLFDRQLELRHRIARNAGFDNFRSYRWRELERFDYTPQHCAKFHAAVKKIVVPIVRSEDERRQQLLELETLRPWDLAVDPDGNDPLRPFTESTDLVAGCKEMFRRVDARFAAYFDDMIDRDLLDLDSRDGKAPGGYQYTLMEQRVPFVFMNASGLQRDVKTMLHEGGHAFHAYECRDLRLTSYRSAPTEFSEVASMAMELIAGEHLDVFYDRPEDARRARLRHLEGVVRQLAWIATIDEFQHWVYTNPGHGRAERESAWLTTLDGYKSGVVDHSGCEAYRRSSWTAQSHVLRSPFYYIEYAIAQLGALQVWRNYRSDPEGALEKYRRSLALGGSCPLPELFETAGAQLEFSESMVAEMLGLVAAEVTRLRGERTA